MIHLYHGDGKGKTTAAMGLAVRMAGRNKGVVIAQFLKGADSGERVALRHLPQITLLPVPEQVKFTFSMTQEELRQEGLRCRALLEQALQLARDPNCGLLVLDEACDAVNAGCLSAQELLDVLEPLAPEVVLTGRNPHPALLERADYVTYFQAVRHPFSSGHPARKGVEF